MPYRDREIEKQYYSISEVAEMFEVNASLIRFWEKEFPMLKPKKNSKGTRKFTPKDIEVIRTVLHLTKDRGFTLDGARKYLSSKPDVAEREAEISERLHGIRSFLIELKKNL